MPSQHYLKGRIMESLFVYGTLKRGGRNQGVMGRIGAEFRILDAVAGRIIYVMGGLPGLVHSETSVVQGEIYDVPSQTLETLDEFEGVPSGFYERRKVLTTGKEEVWVYYLCTDDPIIEQLVQVPKEGALTAPGEREFEAKM